MNWVKAEAERKGVREMHAHTHTHTLMPEIHSWTMTRRESTLVSIFGT
jgi:hypothetical protein